MKEERAGIAEYEHLLPTVIALGTLKTANHLLGDRAALNRAWQQDGYWFFRDVIDKRPLAEIRGHVTAYLKGKGLIDDSSGENIYSGLQLEKADVTAYELLRLLHFNRIDLDKVFTQHPSVDRLITDVLGDKPFWLPQTDFRAVPPLGDPNKSRLASPHQDGFFTPGVEMKTCWVPLDNIDREIGGCAWLEGAHNGPGINNLDDPAPYHFHEVPSQGWKSAEFEPGDIVIFHSRLPHSGLTNISKSRFRFSFDMRVVASSENTARVGNITQLSPAAVAIRNRNTGKEENFLITESSFVKDNRNTKLTADRIFENFSVGDLVLITSTDGCTASAFSPAH